MTQLNRRHVLQGTAATALVAVAGRTVFGSTDAMAATVTNSSINLGDLGSLDGRPAPTHDYSRANKLPREMTGFWEKSFDVAGVQRTAKVLLPAETPIRSYYIVLTVPDGIDAATFLRRTGWHSIAEQRGEGLFLLESGPEGWGTFEDELAYVRSAMAFYESNPYFSIFGEHYLVGYGGGGPALEAWAAENPLRVIAQAYLGSAGLPAEYLAGLGSHEYDGTTAGYTPVDFPDGFDLIRRDEVVLPTWYVAPLPSFAASLAYWRGANDTTNRAVRHDVLGTVFRQRESSERWMTSWSGPISQVAVQDRDASWWSTRTTARLLAWLSAFTRYENFFAYGNQLLPRPDHDRLGVEVRTMQVAGYVREYLVYVPESARRIWGDKAPVVFVWPGNTQTDKLFFDSSQWWQVARDEGCVLVVICEQYNASAISVSHRDSDAFYRQLRDVVTRRYAVDPTRFYSTGQSAGSAVTQTLAITKPEYFAAVASTSFTIAPGPDGTVPLDGVAHAAARRPIPNYQVYGYGDLGFIEGDLWDDIHNNLDAWADYHLEVNHRTLADVDVRAGRPSGWHDRFRTWTWTNPETGAPMLKLSKNLFRSHNNIPEETPMLWDFLRHYKRTIGADGKVRRFYSPSGFRRKGDDVVIPS